MLRFDKSSVILIHFPAFLTAGTETFKSIQTFNTNFGIMGRMQIHLVISITGSSGGRSVPSIIFIGNICLLLLQVHLCATCLMQYDMSYLALSSEPSGLF